MKNKNKILAATAIVTAAAVIALIIKNKRSGNSRPVQNLPVYKPTHHRTEIFAKAKENIN